MVKYVIKYKELTEYLKTLKREDFQVLTNPYKCYVNKVMVQMKVGLSYEDIEFYEMDKHKIPLGSLIDYGTPFLVDAIGNDLSIIVQTKRKYKLPSGRSVKGKFDRTLIDDCRELYGTSLNGYWIIPDRFLIRIK